MTTPAPGDDVYADLLSYLGGFAEYVCAPAREFAPLPEGLSFVEASAVPQAGVIAVSGILDRGGVRAGQRVLVNGAGGGAGTYAVQLAVRAGASVTAVDWSEPMLRSARRRAPGATFVQCEITAYVPNGEYDLVLLAFVLHEISREDRALALWVARSALAREGRLAVGDHAEPSDGYLPKAVFKFVHAFEPPSIAEWARESFEPEIERAGFEITRRGTFARGTARAVIARRS